MSKAEVKQWRGNRTCNESDWCGNHPNKRVAQCSKNALSISIVGRWQRELHSGNEGEGSEERASKRR